jgi:phosphate transport system substrate-binding protein
MTGKRCSKYLLSLILLTALLLYACDYTKIKQVSTSGEITVEVDENIAPVIKKAGDEFMRLNKDAKLNLVVKTSSEVTADFINGDSKTIISCRDFTQKEKDVIAQNKIDIKKNLFCLDGIGIIVNPQNPIKLADLTEIKKIFTGEITDWADLEGMNKDLPQGRIKVFISRKNSSTHDFFRSSVLVGGEFAKSNTVCSTSTQMLDEIRNNKFAIGYVSMSWITKAQDTLDTTVKPLKIAPVDSLSGKPYGEYIGFYQAYIADKSYPLVMESYIFSRDFSMNLSVGFISFMLGYDGQKVILKSGLVPVTQPVKIIQLN